jgi:hypothetical protein
MERTWKEADVAYLKAVSRHFPGRAKETSESRFKTEASRTGKRVTIEPRLSVI